MESMGNGRLSLAAIKELDMVGYLEKIGYLPAAIKKDGTDHWYLSPLRDEGDASFHINQLTNQWYDFGLSEGGNMVDFCLRYHRCSIKELLDKFNDDLSTHRLPAFDRTLHEGRVIEESKLIIKDVRPICSYPLKNYLHERSIPVSVAEQYCKELSYEINGRLYYGIGFKNDAGGYEIRNKIVKQSSSPKDVTTLNFGASDVKVFEGFMDFLSYQALHPHVAPGTSDFVVLNGAGMFDRALSFLSQHESVGLWLDHDVTGMRYTEYALSLGSQYRDESSFYKQHKDLNDWLIHKGEVPKPHLRPSSGLRPSG